MIQMHMQLVRESVVGVKREAIKLGISMEEYYRRFCDELKKSALSEPLKSQVVSLIDYNDFYGYGVIVITIPLLASYSSYDGDIYYRAGDNTVKATVIEAADIQHVLNERTPAQARR